MATGKEFQTTFIIGAQWRGQKGVSQAQKALHGTAQAAQRVHTRMKGVYKSASRPRWQKVALQRRLLRSMLRCPEQR